MRIQYRNALIAPFCGADALFPGEVHTEDDRIRYVGPPVSAPGAFERSIDCSNLLLLPGFKNAHSHAGMTFLRSFADDLPLKSWLYDQVLPRERGLTPADIYALTRLAILEYMAGGITSAFDMYYFREQVAQAAVDAGFRICLTDGVNDFGGSAKKAEAEFDRFNRLHPLVSYQLCVHAEYTTGLPLLADMAALARQKRAPLYSHMNETAQEVQDCVARHGMRPFELFDSLGLFDYGGGGFHCVHLSEAETEILRRRGLIAVTCPGSNLKLGSGIPDIYELNRRGVRVALGTDGPASNNALDFFREMYLTAVLPKLLHGADALDALSVLQMACVNGAYALGLPDCDCLAAGRQADFVLLDQNDPAMQPRSHPLKNVVYAGGKQAVAMTVIAGKIVYDRGEFPGQDADGIRRAAAAAARRLLQ